MNWNGRRVMVTGAGGFIGSHLIDELLSRGAEVTAFVHYNARNDWGMLEGRYAEETPHLKVIAGDVTDSIFVKKAVYDMNVVFHLAAGHHLSGMRDVGIDLVGAPADGALFHRLGVDEIGNAARLAADDGEQ